MFNVVVCKGRNEKVAVIVIRLHSQFDATINTSFLRRSDEILW